jgi:cysteinyl-tRNA synthetase
VQAARSVLDDFDAVFGVLSLRDSERARLPESVERRIVELVEAREEARRRRDWVRADAIRDELEGQGVVLEDGPDGTRWRVRDPLGTPTEAAAGPVDG